MEPCGAVITDKRSADPESRAAGIVNLARMQTFLNFTTLDSGFR